MKVSIDLGACCGQARCYAIDPENFQLDESGYALRASFEILVEAEDKARMAVASCPEGVISAE